MEIINYCLAKLEIMRSLKRDERGVTALEYGLIAGFLGVGLLATLTIMGPRLVALFAAISQAIANATAAI